MQRPFSQILDIGSARLFKQPECTTISNVVPNSRITSGEYLIATPTLSGVVVGPVTLRAVEVVSVLGTSSSIEEQDAGVILNGDDPRSRVAPVTIMDRPSLQLTPLGDVPRHSDKLRQPTDI